MARTEPLPVNVRAALVEDARANGCTLDGKPAYITGSTMEFAMVRLKGSGLAAEFSWPTVQRILGSHRGFQS